MEIRELVAQSLERGDRTLGPNRLAEAKVLSNQRSNLSMCVVASSQNKLHPQMTPCHFICQTRHD